MSGKSEYAGRMIARLEQRLHEADVNGYKYKLELIARHKELAEAKTEIDRLKEQLKIAKGFVFGGLENDYKEPETGECTEKDKEIERLNQILTDWNPLKNREYKLNPDTPDGLPMIPAEDKKPVPESYGKVFEARATEDPGYVND